jgi:hypothetical protein
MLWSALWVAYWLWALTSTCHQDLLETIRHCTVPEWWGPNKTLPAKSPFNIHNIQERWPEYGLFTHWQFWGTVLAGPVVPIIAKAIYDWVHEGFQKGAGSN